MSGVLPVSVIVPTLNAGSWIGPCLESLQLQRPREIVVVDGGSTDDTVSQVRSFGIKPIIHTGVGPAAARQTGADRTYERWLAFIDADIIVPNGALAALLEEAERRKLEGLQARFVSYGGPDYWGRQIARHHNRAPSGGWFGVSATVLSRRALQTVPFDPTLASGEDVDLRRRLRQAGIAIGTSTSTTMSHQYAPGFAATRRQWLDDGAGLGRLVRKEGLAMVPWAFLPFASAAAGLVRSVTDGFRSAPYYIGHAVGNAVGLIDGLLDRRVELAPRGQLAVGVTVIALWLAGVLALGVPLAVLLYLATHVGAIGRWILGADLFSILMAAAVAGILIMELRRADRPAGESRGTGIRRAYLALAAAVLLVAVLRLTALLGIL